MLKVKGSDKIIPVWAKDCVFYMRNNWRTCLILEESIGNKELAIAKGPDGRAVSSRKGHQVKTEWGRSAQVNKDTNSIFPPRRLTLFLWLARLWNGHQYPWLWPIKVWRTLTLSLLGGPVLFKLWGITCCVLKNKLLIRSPGKLDSACYY